MDSWEAGRNGMLVEETLRTCKQYHTVSCREESEDHRYNIYNIILLQGKMKTVVRWVT